MKAFLLVVSLIFISGNVLANTEQKTWAFDVYLDDKWIGEHKFVMTQQGERKTLEITANFKVKFLFITAYEYLHRNKEEWEHHCLTRIESYTNDNGTEYQIKGNLSHDTFLLRQNNSSNKLENCIQTYSYWDPMIVQQNLLLNSQTGNLDRIEVKALGKEFVEVAGKTYEAERYQLKNEKFSIDLWYSLAGEWLSLRSTMADGNVLNYKLKGV